MRPASRLRFKAAEQIYQEYMHEQVASVGISVPLKAKPTKHLAILLEPGAAGDNLFVGKGFTAAGKLVRWGAKVIFYDNTNPAAVNSAVLEAISEKPNYIGVSGVPISNYENALKEAKADGIPVFASLITGGVDPSEDIVAQTGGTPRWDLYGEELAAFGIVRTGGHAKVVFFQLGDYPSLNQEEASEQATYKKDRPTCTFAEVPISLPELNQGDQPSLVVSYLQSHKGTNVVDIATGGQTVGLDAALRSAGYTNSTGVLEKGLITECGDPQSADLKAILAGQETMCVGLPSEMDGWYVMDAMLRYSEGMSVTPSYVGSIGPSPMLTATTLGTYEPVIPNAGPYMGPKNYASVFAKLWLV